MFIPLGTSELVLSLNTDLEFGKGVCKAGSIRVVILPFRDQAGQDQLDGGDIYNAYEASLLKTRITTHPSPAPQVSEEVLLTESAVELHYAIDKVLQEISRSRRS